MKRAMTSALVVTLVVTGVAACGGSNLEKAPAAAAPGGAPQNAYPEPTKGAATEAPAETTTPRAQDAAPATPPPPAAPASAPQPSGMGPQVALQRARAEIDAAERALQTSAGDCTAACRALASMDRAAGHLCEMDPGTCEQAKARVLAARDRVRNTCGSCPGGPSVERNAPVPSMNR